MFNWLFTKRSSIENPSVPIGQALDLLTSSRSSTGMSINARSVLGNPAVKKGVELLSSSVANLPLITYKRGENGSRDRASTHLAYKLLKKAPSERYTAYTFKKTLMQQAIIYGNAFARIRRNELGKPVELRLLDPEQTEVIEDSESIRYKTKLNNQDLMLGFSDCLHIKGALSYNGIVGMSLLDTMREAFANGLALQSYANHFFKNGTLPSIALELPPHVRDPEKVAAWRAAWQQVHSGLSNSNKAAVLQSGSKLHQMSGTNEGSQFIEARELDLVLVSDILNIQPHKLGSSISTSYASLESENKAFLQDSLECWLCNIEQECEQKLLSEREKDTDSHFIEFERRKLLAIDAKTEAEVLVSEYNNGLLSWAEVRAILNKPTEKDFDDGWRRPANIVVETDEPQEEPEPAPEPAIEPDGSTDAKEVESDTEPLRALLKSVVERCINRVAKAAESKSKQAGFSEWVSQELELQHRSVFVDAIKPVANGQSEQVVDAFFDDLKAELQAVSSADVPTVMARHRLDTANTITNFVMGA